ncbi:hypothetical protein WMF37_26435 [Sorangium sp. So ce291]|uniref:hypothetical protein n=1 Tax=Sorangium sp. So ce291 TaxID=3133294 RepID=UPI003F62874B
MVEVVASMGSCGDATELASRIWSRFEILAQDCHFVTARSMCGAMWAVDVLPTEIALRSFATSTKMRDEPMGRNFLLVTQ